VWAALLGDPVIAGKTVQVFGRGENPIALVASDDVARITAVLGTGPERAGVDRVEFGGPGNLTALQMVEIFSRLRRREFATFRERCCVSCLRCSDLSLRTPRASCRLRCGWTPPITGLTRGRSWNASADWSRPSSSPGSGSPIAPTRPFPRSSAARRRSGANGERSGGAPGHAVGLSPALRSSGGKRGSPRIGSNAGSMPRKTTQPRPSSNARSIHANARSGSPSATWI